MRTWVCDVFPNSATPCLDFFLFVWWPVAFVIMIAIMFIFWWLDTKL